MIYMKSLLLVFSLMLTAAVYAKPVAKFSIKAEHIEAPATIQFINESVGAENYVWNFGDGHESTDASAMHKYAHSGTYEVTLTAIKGKKTNTMTQSITIEPSPKCLVEITTDFGVMVAELYDATPQHRDNFMKLAEEGFYNDLLFHRVIDGFMIQGGDPSSKEASAGVPLGSGGPGHQVPAEFVDSLVHIKGAIAAARTSDSVNPERKSSGSQFYIVEGGPVDDGMLDGIEKRKGFTYTPEQRKAYLELGGTPFLDHDYTVYGRVIKGLEVIDAITKVKKDARDRPIDNIKMTVKVIK